jgi:hemerythrin-like domain-containing protein
MSEPQSRFAKDGFMKLLSALLLIFSVQSSLGAKAKPSEAFRKEHLAIRDHLNSIDKTTGELAQQKPETQKVTMNKIVSFFAEHIRPHAEWEEKVLYPAVDKRAKSGENLFTATMRHEHKIVGRWIDELKKQADAAKPDASTFVRKTDKLLGLILAHFEEEEDVLLSVLDRSMTTQEFEREILKTEAKP